MERNHLCNSERGDHGEHSCEVILNFGPVVQEEMSLKKKFTDDGSRTHDGQRPITIPHLRLR